MLKAKQSKAKVKKECSHNERKRRKQKEEKGNENEVQRMDDLQRQADWRVSFTFVFVMKEHRKVL